MQQPDFGNERKRAILHKFDALKASNGGRDQRHHDVSAIRRGDVEQIMPGFFPRSWPRSVIANTIDIASTDLGEMVGTLPTISCPATRTSVHTAIAAAEKRTRIVNGYVAKSRLQKYMYSGADRMFSFGFMPLVVEPDFDQGCPVIRVDDPVGAYYELDLFGNTRCYFKRWYESVESLKAKFPELTPLLKDRFHGGEMGGATDLEVVKYYGPDYTCLFMPTLGDGHMLRSAPNPMKQVQVFIAERPKWDGEVRGQFDQALFVQLARAKMSGHMLDVADQAVNAPTIVPRDLLKLPMGPKALWHTDNPAGAGKLKIEVPPQVFAEGQNLLSEERIATRYPEGRTGNIDASVITGQGVDALLGTMSTQIKVAQDQIRDAVADALSFGLRMDREYWPDAEKDTRGVYENIRFSDRYTPGKDIDSYEVEATYGMLSGMDFNRALVAMLQLQGGGIISKGAIRRSLPEGMGGHEVVAERDIEDLGDAMKQSVFGMAGAVPALAANGQDPARTLGQIARMMKLREDGKPLQDAVLKALEPTPEEKAAAEQAASQQAAANPVGSALGAAGAVTPGTAPGGNEGMGSIQQMLAGLTSAGEPQLSARVSRALPA